MWKYGSNTTANVLEVIPSGVLIQIAILIAALQLCLSNILGQSALFQHLEDHLNVKRCMIIFIPKYK